MAGFKVITEASKGSVRVGRARGYRTSLGSAECLVGKEHSSTSGNGTRPVACGAFAVLVAMDTRPSGSGRRFLLAFPNHRVLL